MMAIAQAIFWAIVGYLAIPPLVKFVRDWWSLRQARKRVVNLSELKAKLERESDPSSKPQ